MSKLAIINCKSKKQNYKCVAEEMYNISFQFRHQTDFIKEYYDDYLILSSKYGLISPNKVIDLLPIKDILDNKTKHVKQPVNPGLVKNRYVEALEIYKDTGNVNVYTIGERRKSKDPELERWWYHKNYKPFFGFARHLRKKYPIVDEGNASRVSRGLNFHTQGWVIKKEYLDQLNEKNGKWRKK